MPPTEPSQGTETRHVPQRVWEWLARLHALTAGSSSADEAKMRIDLVAPLIAERFPVDAFTQRSLEAVASASRFWPAYGELVERLTPWWRDNRPRPLALTPPPSPSRGEPTPEELAEVDRIMGAWAAERAEREMALAMAEPPMHKLPDVTLKGEALRLSRERRGIRTVDA